MEKPRDKHRDPADRMEPEMVRDSDAAGVPLDLETISSQAFAQRPDLRASQISLQSAEQGLRIASATRWPSVSLSMGYNSSFNTANDDPFFDQIDARRALRRGVGRGVHEPNAGVNRRAGRVVRASPRRTGSEQEPER